MRQYIPVITLALFAALALAVVSGGLLPSDNAVLADHIDAPTNTAPAFATGGGTRSIAENLPAGVNIGAPISATDADGDVLTYSLDATGGETFDIDESTGQLITKAALNQEGTPSYTVTVTADDGRETTTSSTEQSVTISVGDEDEEPGQPAPPVITTGAVSGSETTTLEINWYAPENTGEAINDYDYRYKKTTDTTWTVVEGSTSDNDTDDEISSLDADTAYQVSVRAGSPEGDSPWSIASVGSTNKEGNAAPEFPNTENGQRSVLENTPSGQRVGATITATDANSLSLTYSLEGRDKDSFNIDSSTGQIRTKAPLNHEGKSSYSVFVVVEDGDGGSDVIAVTIAVTDASEQPSQPAAPTVERVADDPEGTNNESTTMLKISWVAPATTGPAISSYNVEYREGTSGAFLDDNCGMTGNNNCQNITGTETVITDLMPNKSYQVRITAISDDEQNSLPSPTRTGSTMPSNNPPVFSQNTRERTVNENTPEGTNIGRPITATEPDRGDTLTYSLVDPDPNADTDPEDLFDIDEATGQLKTKAVLNHEDADCGYVDTDNPTGCEYSVTVAATDQKEAMDTIEVTIKVRDTEEPPSAPSGLVVTVDRTNFASELDVTWTAPGNEGKPSITEYQVQYRASGSWTSLTGVGTDTSAEITGLEPFTNYAVQVRAINAEGNSDYVSSSERTSKADNSLPTFSPDTDTRAVDENTARGQPVGEPVTATDADDDTLEYSLEGAHASQFDIDSSSGQIKVKVPLNFEAECSAADSTAGHEEACTYSVVVKAIDGNGGSHSATVTIMVNDDATEAPSTPSAPTVMPAVATEDEPYLDPTTMLAVTWPEPANEGPSITTYAIQYKVMGGGDFLTDISGDIITFEDGSSANRSAVIRGLDDDTTYQVRVMATNAEGMTSWSPVRAGKTRFANTRPQFSNDINTLSVEENTRSNQSIGRPVTATDDDGHTLTYTLEGVHKDVFSIERGSGHIRTRGALDYESRNSYSVTVRASDTHGGSAATSVTINVLDEQESPTTPGRPTVTAVSGSSDSVRVTWAAPSNAGRPPIVDYDVQYRAAGGQYSPWTHEGTDTSTIITGLSAGTRYDVQVKAWNMEDDSDWSTAGTGSPDPDPANNPPSFSGGTRNFTVQENSAAGVNIGIEVLATDPDDDDLSYSLEGADSASFEIVELTGQIQTKADVDYNYEATKNSYSVTVRASDDRGGSATVAVNIAVTDSGVDEPPEAPDAPTVEATSNSNTSLDVSWTAPENPGPAITDYDYQYKESSSSTWTVVADTTITATSITISSLSPQTSYDVQVRAINADDEGDWSDSGTGSTSEPAANNAPVFAEGTSTTRSISEGAAGGSAVGLPVTATDADNDTLVYTLEGTDMSSFDITSSGGQILLGTSTVLDASTKSTYSVTVVANDGTVTATIDVTITVEQAADVAPSVPDMPTVTATAGSTTSLDVSWDTPDNQGPPITDYDYRYRIFQGTGGIIIVRRWIEVTDTTITDTSVTIENLTTGTEYEVQVRATNSSGTTDWSDSGRGTPGDAGTNNPPEFASASTSRVVDENTPPGTYIADPVSATDDDAGDTLTYTLSGTDASSFNIDRNTGQLMTRAALDYEVRRSYVVTVTVSDGTDTAEIRVSISVMDMYPGCTTQDVGNRGLTNDCETLLDAKVALEGRNGVPLNWSERRPLADWDGFQGGRFPSLSGTPMRVTALHLQRRGLDGEIPAALGRLSELSYLTLWGNSLHGTVPGALGSLTNLERLYINNNELTGFAASGLEGMTSLKILWAHRNHMGGRIPTQLADITSLEWLSLYSNRFTGGIPGAELARLTNLKRLYLHRNDLGGSIPSQLGDMTSLTHVVLMRTGVSGPIPDLSRLTNLVWLALYDNDLSGSIPSSMGDLSSLEVLYLHGNDLSGSVPSDLGDLSNLTNLWLKDNNLNGQLPAVLGELPNLERVRIAGTNSFTGCVPAGLLDGTGRTSDAEALGLPTCN